MPLCVRPSCLPVRAMASSLAASSGVERSANTCSTQISGNSRAMFRTGLLLLTRPVHKLSFNIPALLTGAFQLVHETLYIHLAPDLLSTSHDAPGSVPCTDSIKRFVLGTYVSASAICSSPDVRFLLCNITDRPMKRPHSLKAVCQVVITEETSSDDHGVLLKYVTENFGMLDDVAVEIVHSGQFATSDNGLGDNGTANDSSLVTTYDNVVLGGTFDNLHIGHKILLTEACLHANKSITVGVTDTCMNTNKLLGELIRPTETRIADVRDFLEDVKPGLEYNVVPITDPYGPTLEDASIECLVVSEETSRGGELINVKRRERGLSCLDVVTIDIVEDRCHSPEEEVKISSSSLRKRLLGTLLREPKYDPKLPSRPYIIGLTGGTGSGKSSVCRRLNGQGAAIVDCDKLGHKAYVKGTETLTQLVSAFGQDILDANGEVDRRILGSKVFTDKSQLDKLNEIVWPAIAELALEEIEAYTKEGKEVVVLDAAVLLEASWDSMVHEVWTTLVPKDEAVRRIMERNGLSKEEAVRRIDSQLSNQARVHRANVVVCTLWEYEVTQKQVEKAWALLKTRLPKIVSQ